MEYKPKSRRADDSLLRVNRQGPSVQRSLGPDLSYKPAPLPPNPHVSPRQLHLQRTEKQLTDFTVSPVVAQRQALTPMLEGLQLQREVLSLEGPVSHRQTLQRQIEVHQSQLSVSQLQVGQYEAAVQRQADLQTPVAPLTQRPGTPAQWSQGGQWEVQRVANAGKPGHTISLREQEQSQHLGLLRTVGTQLGQGFRADTGPAVQRYAEYGAALAPFQRLGTGTGRAVVTTALMQVPASQRQALQRAIDDTIQRQQAQETQDRAVIQLHSLQRQLEHLNGQPEQPVMEQIQARRGNGNPIPTALRKALELELNHDLGAVRLHHDAEADTLAKKVNAVAFTTGQDIFFRAGTFNPNTRTGVELIAHEVKHTKQQAQGMAKPGIDGDAGQEHDARSFGASFAAGHFALPTARLSQGKRQPGRSPASQHAASWAVQRRAGPTPVTTPKVLPTGGKLAVIKHLDGANLHASPHGGPTSVLLPLGTKLSELSKTADGWSRVVTAHGQQGYVQSLRLTTDLPDAGASLIKVEAGTTAIGIAERYYKALVKPGQDLRFYVNVLIDLDQRRGTGAFQSGQTLKAGQALWVPGPALAQSLVGQVGSGSITGGMWAEAKSAIGNSPGANILRSVLESPQYITEVLGELWAQVKEHWALILGTTAALVGAELLVGALAAAPEPTTITKFLAVGLQGLITAIAGAGLIVGLAQATIAGKNWLTAAWAAKGDAGKLKAASKAFLSMVGNLVVAVASVAGVRASAVKTGALAKMPTKVLNTPATALQTPTQGQVLTTTKTGGVVAKVPKGPQNYIDNKYWKYLAERDIAENPAEIARLRASLPELKGLTDSEIIAIRQYTTRAYVPLNSALRAAGDPVELKAANTMLSNKFNMPPVKTTDANIYSQELTTALKKLPPYTGTVFRGEGTDRLAFFQAMKPGDVWIEEAYFSTASDVSGAMTYKEMVFRIKSASGRKISDISTYAQELEILFSPGTKFRFLSISLNQKTGKWNIVVEEM